MAAFVLAALVIAAVVLWQRRRRGATTAARRDDRKRCRWSATGSGTAAFAEYRCDTCGVTAYGHGGAPPRLCKRGLDRGSA